MLFGSMIAADRSHKLFPRGFVLGQANAVPAVVALIAHVMFGDDDFNIGERSSADRTICNHFSPRLDDRAAQNLALEAHEAMRAG
jgi:hypothetical protein